MAEPENEPAVQQASYSCPQCGGPMAGTCGETCRNCGFRLGCGTEP